MKRKRIAAQSAKMTEWLADYRKAKDAVTPTECARCGTTGEGWESNGGDFQPHHLAGRYERWRMLLFVATCRECHRLIHDDGATARDQQWLLKPQTFDIYGNKKPR